MLDHIPSRTAFRVAMRRAVHQLLDHPKVLDDPLALAILGEETASELRAAPKKFEKPGTTTLRAFMAARGRFAEDRLRCSAPAPARKTT